MQINFYFYQIDKGMMDELKDVKRVLNPTEVLLVVDAMTGQEAAGICAQYSLSLSLASLRTEQLVYWNASEYICFNC